MGVDGGQGGAPVLGHEARVEVVGRDVQLVVDRTPAQPGEPDLEVVGEDFEPSWALIFDPELTTTYPGGVSVLNGRHAQLAWASLVWVAASLERLDHDMVG